MKIRRSQKSFSMIYLGMMLSLFSCSSESQSGGSDSLYQMQRNRMVDSQIIARDITDKNVIAAMRKVPRHLFVPEEYRHQAHSDGPLPIGHNQTISQPYIVAIMTELMAVDSSSRVLEIGTGSGYQAAVLAEIAESVYSIEIVTPLAERAAEISLLNVGSF